MKSNDPKGSVLRPLLKRIYPVSAVMTAVCFAVTLIWGFSAENLIGFALGWGYMCLCYEYLARVCERAVASEKSRAVRMMRVCYAVRFAGLFILCAAAALTGLANFTGILLPQFFPKIILMFSEMSGSSKKG